MDGVEAVAVAQEVGGCLAATTDATELDHLRLVDVQLPDSVDNALADAVMPAALAKSRRLAAIVGLFQTNGIGLWRAWCGSALLNCFHIFPLCFLARCAV